MSTQIIDEETSDILDEFFKHQDIMCSRSGRKEYPFHFQVEDPNIQGTDDVFFEVTREGVCVINYFKWPKDDDWFREDHEMTHEKCLEYLSQLPRPWYRFTNGWFDYLARQAKAN